MDLRALFAQIGSMVKCPICHEFLDAPVSFSECVHVFCSACISSALRHRSECPVCRGNREASKLTPVPILDKITTAFRQLPEDEVDKLLYEPAAKRARVDVDDDDDEDDDDDDDCEEVDVGLSQRSQRVSCPSCGVLVRNLVDHEVECLGRGDKERERFAKANAEAQRQVPPAIPPFHFKQLRLKARRDLCRKYGLKDSGNEEQLEWRLTVYRDEFNANRLRTVPKSEEKMKRELQQQEAHRAAKPKVKTKQTVKWESLIAKAARKEPPPQPSSSSLIEVVVWEASGSDSAKESDASLLAAHEEDTKNHGLYAMDCGDDDEDDVDELVAAAAAAAAAEAERREEVAPEPEPEPEPEVEVERVGPPPRWTTVFSSAVGRNFYYDRELRQGSFKSPPDTAE